MPIDRSNLTEESTTGEAARKVSREDRVLNAAIDLFASRGFHGTSIRAIADKSGLALASMYHYFPSKDAMLVRIMDDVMTGLTSACQIALIRSTADPVDRLGAIVRAHCRFHTDQQKASFVTNSEIRSLSDVERRHHIAARDRHQRMFDSVIADGVERGVFRTPIPVEASRAIVTMTTAVATWYRSDGPLAPDEVADRHTILALAQVEADPETIRRRRDDAQS